MSTPQVSMLEDGQRMHLHHGPIDLIIDADGPGRDAALAAAQTRFETVLDELVAELATLRSPADPERPLTGQIARRMKAATLPFLPDFITPMAAVAGSVADMILAAMVAAGDLTRAYVNNGGDIALHLAPGHSFTAAIAAGRSDRARITADQPVRGIATSGWRGRSLSFGIADGVTVLALTAGQADAAATMIANAVDLPGSSLVQREPASDTAPDSDLGARLVTVGVAPLASEDIDRALARGRAFADPLIRSGLIYAAHLTLQGHCVSVGLPETPQILPA